MAQEHGLEFEQGHSTGPGCATFATSGEDVYALTCGADGNMVLRDMGSLKIVASTQAGKNAYCCVANPKSTYALVCNDAYVKMFRMPSLELDQAQAGHSTLPIRVLACSPDGKQWAMGGDRDNVRIHPSNKEATVTRQLQCEGYVRGLAWDPAGQFIAAAQNDGLLYVWEAATGKAVFKRRVVRKLGPFSETPYGISWHPDGGVMLAVPGTDKDVVLYERHSWTASEYLTGGHQAAVTCAIYSPNGLYVASGDEQGTVCVWEASTQKLIVKGVTGKLPEAGEQQEPAAAGTPLQCVTSLCWHPLGNGLLVMNAAGMLSMWAGCIPDKLPGPAVPIEELAKPAESDMPALQPARDDSMAQHGAAAEEGGADVDAAEAGDAAAAAMDDDTQSMNDFIVHEDGDAKRAARMNLLSGKRQLPPPAPRFVPLPEPACQRPFQPCSTPCVAGTPHFLAYNTQGCIVSRAMDDYHVIEVSFHDVSKLQALGGRIPPITDYYGFTHGSLSDRGVLLGCPPSRDTASMIMYRPFDSWAPASDWVAGLPAGEAVVCLATGASFSAVATSTHLLRIFSTGGLQKDILALQGPPVAMAAQGHMLAVVTVAHAPSRSQATQHLWLTVYDVLTSSCTMSCACPLTPGAQHSSKRSRTHAADQQDGKDQLDASHHTSLTWLGFSDRGALALGDSTGCIYIRSPLWGGSWVPVFNMCDHVKTSETYWPVAMQGNNLLTIMLQPPLQHPQVTPAPYLTPLPLKQPSITVEGGSTQLESELLMATLGAQQARSSCELAGGGGVAKQLLDAAVRGADTAGLRVLQAALKAGRYARAYDAAAMLEMTPSLEGALKLASHHKAQALADRICLLLEAQMEEEAVRQAEEAEAAALEERLAHEPSAVTPIPMKSNGTVTHLAGRTPLSLHPGGQTGAAAQGDTWAPGSAGNPPSTGGAGALTALKKAAAAVTPTGQENQAGGQQKRKPSVAAAPANNPFARRPAKQSKI